MSGRPNKPDIADVLKILTEMDPLQTEIATIQNRISNDQLSLANKKARLSVLEQNLEKLMSGMDLTSKGNYGHEARREVFLIELIRQTREVVKEELVKKEEIPFQLVEEPYHGVIPPPKVP